MTASRPLLETDDLRREFSGFAAVESVDLAVPENETVAVIGPNGAGKTTLLNLVTGLLEPTSGTITFDGEEIGHLPVEQRARRGISLSLQITRVFPSLTVKANVLGALNATEDRLSPFTRYGSDPARNERALELLARVDLDRHAETEADTLSHADQKVLEIALALATDPKLLLLDEPTSGLSAEGTGTVVDLVEDLKGEYTTILIEHDMEAVMRLADRIVVLHQGRVLMEGPPSEVQRDERVREVYLST